MSFHPAVRSLSGAVIALILSAGSTLADWPADPNTNLPICTAPNDQGAVGIASIPDGTGGAIIAWDDLRDSSRTFDIYAQSVDGLGRVRWSANGIPICVRDSIQAAALMVSDGAGGAIIAWADLRSGNFDVYAQRVNAAGVPQWTLNGVAIVSFAGDQFLTSIVPDGSGGAIVAWGDNRSGNDDIYVRRINSAGVPQWAANGVALCTAVGNQDSPHMVSDGAGGAIVQWEDLRAGNSDIYVRAVNAAGTPLWTADGVALCTAAGVQWRSGIVSDGAGGAIVSWEDFRAVTNHDIYARRVNSAGTPLWTANGVGVCTLSSEQTGPSIAADGAGGAIMAWRDDRTSGVVFAQRINSAGGAVWTGNGVPVCTTPPAQNLAGPNPRIISDGAGGAVVAWNDFRVTMAADIYAQRLNAANGSPMWTVNGIPISTATDSQQDCTLVPDGTGGAIYVWQDWRTGVADLYAGRTDGTGVLGIPDPIIDAVRDVPNDQGGRVQVLWKPCFYDAGPSNPVESYNLWRRIVTTSATQAALAVDGGEPGPGSVRMVPDGANATYWEYIVTLPARGAPGYAYTVTTGSDSLPGSIPWNVFFVEAKKGTTFYTSRVDSGYSVDNLSPASPAPFTGNVVGATTRLHWNPNGETDLFGYRLYRGTSAAFTPDPGNLISAQTDTGYTDASVGFYYKLSAVDVHGNESPYALLSPQQTTDVGAPLAVMRLALAGANPARRTMSLTYSLSEPGEARLVVFDPAGRAVKVLASGAHEAGEYSVDWNGVGDSGRNLGSGVYLARLVAHGRSREVQFVLLR